MGILNILWRNIKWRFSNKFTFGIIVLQPLLWLVLYSNVASQTMVGLGILNYTAFILPGVIFLVVFSSCSSGGIAVYLMKKAGGFQRVLIAPVSRAVIVLGQMFEAILVAFLETIILFLVGTLFGVRIASGILGVLLMIIIIFLTAFFMSSIAYSISLSLPNEVVYETIMTAIVLPIFFLSSALFPPDNLTGVLAVIIKINPFTHVINVLRSLLMTSEIMIMDSLKVILLLAVLGVLGFILALNKLKKEAYA